MRATIRCLLGIVALLICFILASCDTGPKDPGEMLAVVLRESSRKPEKAMAAYTRSGQAGRAALIRVFFDIQVRDEDYYRRNEGYGLDSRKFAAFVETLSEDPEFLRAILEVSDAWPRDPEEDNRRGGREAVPKAWSPGASKKQPNEFEWVLARDQGIYAAWLAKLPANDPRLATAWGLYIAHRPDKGLDAFLDMLASLPVEATVGARRLAEAIKRCAPLPGGLAPAQQRFIFINRLEARLLSEWKPDPTVWLLAFPEDLGFALWRDEIETSQPVFAIPWETLREKPVTPERGKALILFSEPGGELCLSAHLMRTALTRESTADSLYRYDRRIEVTLSRTTLFPYFADVTMPGNPSRISGVRSDLTVSCFESQSGKEFWTRTFRGGNPPKETGVPAGGVLYVSGNVPWEEAHAAIRECAAR